MSPTHVDDVWASLKAKSVPRSAGKAGKASLPAVQPVIIAGAVGQSNIVDGHMQKKTVDMVEYDPKDVRDVPRSPQHTDAVSCLAPLQRDINCLTDPDRSIRKGAISKIYGHLVTSKCSPQQLQSVMQGALHRNIITMLSDVAEACRDQALRVLAHVAQTSADFHSLLPSTMNALKLRMGVGQSTFTEPSEEVRLAIAQLVSTTLVALSTAASAPYKEDLVSLLIRSLDDPFHETKKVAFAGITTLAHSLPVGSLEAEMPKLLEAITGTFHHAHSRVRLAAIDALSNLIQRTPVSEAQLSEQVVPSVRTLALDRSSSIRIATLHSTAIWLGAPTTDGGTCPSCNPARYAPHLVPILLLGITDPNHDVAAHALEWVEQAGAHFCSQILDLESGLTPSTDVATSSSLAGEADQEAITSAAHLPHPFSGRAAEPARRMVKHQLPVILPPVMKEMREWTVALRLPASRSMYSMAALAEAALLPHLPVLLPALCSAVADQDEAIALRVIGTAQIVGAFCEVRSCPLHLTEDHPPSPTRNKQCLQPQCRCVHRSAVFPDAVLCPSVCHMSGCTLSTPWICASPCPGAYLSMLLSLPAQVARSISAT
jgi:dynein assembly factor 5, axonemal